MKVKVMRTNLGYLLKSSLLYQKFPNIFWKHFKNENEFFFIVYFKYILSHVLKISWNILRQHQSIFLRSPEYASIEFHPFQTPILHYINFSKGNEEADFWGDSQVFDFFTLVPPMKWRKWKLFKWAQTLWGFRKF